MKAVSDTFKGRRVLVTGHTGFIAGWLSMALVRAGAKVHGYSLPPPTEPCLFDAVRLGELLDSDERGDVRNGGQVAAAFARVKPDLVYHLAAQPVVRQAWSEPVETIDTNLMGSVRVLEAIRGASQTGLAGAVMMTTDKVYTNREWDWPYRETDRLGGDEPYSASKAAAEMMIEAYRNSYLKSKCRLAAVRAGNVIGGGDWAKFRILPDAARAFSAGEPLVVRNPVHVRPWQHVLDVVAGLMLVGARVLVDDPAADEAWNIAPPTEEQVTVAELIEAFAKSWGGGARWTSSPDGGPKEMHLLRLDASRARAILGWAPVLTMEQRISISSRWYRAFYAGEEMRARSLADIAEVLG